MTPKIVHYFDNLTKQRNVEVRKSNNELIGRKFPCTRGNTSVHWDDNEDFFIFTKIISYDAFDEVGDEKFHKWVDERLYDNYFYMLFSKMIRYLQYHNSMSRIVYTHANLVFKPFHIRLAGGLYKAPYLSEQEAIEEEIVKCDGTAFVYQELQVRQELEYLSRLYPS